MVRCSSAPLLLFGLVFFLTPSVCLNCLSVTATGLMSVSASMVGHSTAPLL
jgi:hypothetical protein